MVCQKEWAVQICYKRKKRTSSRVYYAMLIYLSIEIIYILLHPSKAARHEVECFRLRRRQEHKANFNFNIFSTQECLRNFRLKPNDMKVLLPIFHFPGRTVRRDYVCNKVTASSIFLRRI